MSDVMVPVKTLSTEEIEKILAVQPEKTAGGELVFPEMQVIVARPPVWDDCVQLIGATPLSTIFAWGNIIYNPDDIVITDYLRDHEGVHQRQQFEMGGPEKWWARYLDDVYFRIRQEVEAYAVQYGTMQEVIRDRNQRYRLKVDLARKLAGPLYGQAITNSAALAMLEAEIKRIS